MEQIDSAVLEKLDKIQSMIDGATTPGEAEAAAAAMTRLLERHNLEAMDVASRLGKTSAVEVYRGAMKNSAAWRGMLLHVIAKNHGGKVVTHSGGKDGFTVVATKGRRVEILDMYARFEPLVELLAKRATAEAGDEYEASGRDRRWFRWVAWGNAYRIGFCAGLDEAMKAAKKDAVASYAGGAALVALEDKDVADKFREAFPSIRTTTINTSSSAGYSLGHSAGRGSLTKQIG